MKPVNPSFVAAAILQLAIPGWAAPRFEIIDPIHLQVSVLGGSTYKMQQVANERFYKSYQGPRALGKAYQKHGIAIPASLQQLLQQILQELQSSSQQSSQPTVQTTGEGSVSATPELFDSEYLAAVELGTPPQTLMMDFDTGSADFWVFSSETPTADEAGQKIYNIGASSTARKLTDATWSIRYGDGSSSAGDVWVDTVSIGGVAVQSQAVESALQLSSTFVNNSASSGLLGLAFSSLNQVAPVRQNTFFANAQDTLAMPLFTANLKPGEAGNYNFGYLDSSEFTGSISFVDVNATSGFWQFTANGYQVGSDAPVSAPHTAIADTGTSLLLLPEEIVEAYYAQVPSAQNSDSIGGYVFPCGANLPDFTANIGGYNAVVPGSLINYAPADSDSFATATLCFGGIQASTALPFAIYGDVFLKSQFVVFQGGTTQLGFATKVTTT